MTADFSIIGGSELVIISAENNEKLIKEVSRLITFIDRIPDCSLVDVAYTCSLMRGESVLALVASSVQDLRDRLSSARNRLESGTVTRLKDKSGTYYFRDHLLGEGKGKLAFVFPGAISFYPDMLRDLVVLHPECRAPFDELEEALAGESGFTPSNFIFPPAPYYRHDADIFSSGAYSQALVATYAGCAAMSRLLFASGLKPDGVVGCGGGDLAAVMISGATTATTSRSERVKALRDIYKIVSKAVDNKGLPKIVMVTAMVRHEEDLNAVLASFPKKTVYLVCDFSPKMKTLAIEPDFEETAMKAFANAGIRILRLELDKPFNTPNCAPIVPAIKKFATDYMKQKSVCEVYSCASADKLPDSPRAARKDLAERWAKSVLFAQTIRKMYEDGYKVFVEVGPRGIMTGAVEETLSGRQFAAVALNSIHRRSLLQVQHALAQLAALGAGVDISGFFVRRRAKQLDFDATLSMEFRTVIERKLSRSFPKMTLLGEPVATGVAYTGEPTQRGSRAAERAAAKAARESSRLQFAAGTSDPLISDAPPTESIPGVSYEFTKLFRISEAPFIADFAYGVSQLSYSDPNLRGLVLLPIPLAVEIMAETAQRVVPNRVLVRIEDFICRRRVAFSKGELKLTVKAERVSPADPSTAAVKVQIRDDTPDAQFTWPLMEANFIMSAERLEPTSADVEPLAHPRSVHWSGRDIYPSKLGFGSRLRGIVFAESWAESGINYQVEVPSSSGSVTFTLMPSWTINPLLLQIVTSGFMLWRCHEKFTGAFSFPFRFRRLELKGSTPKEGTRLNCYLRLTGVTPRSHLCDITVTGGNGNVVMEIDGWEEITERVPKNFCDMVLQPATSFISDCVPPEVFGDPGTDVASAVITDVPYPMFERNEELWLKILSNVVLNAPERREAAKMKGSVARRTEWLFGRIAVKEAVRRYLKNFHQARWSYADVQIWPNENGKPQAIGAWGDNLTSKLDVAIAHTSQFVIALAAANAKIGVDVESISRNLSEEFTYGVFSPEELEHATKAANASQAIIRFWCAKEAVSKALGTGIRYSPKEMVVTNYLPDSGNVTMRLTGAWLEVFKNFTGRDIPVSTRIVKDHALAFSFIPASLFNED